MHTYNNSINQYQKELSRNSAVGAMEKINKEKTGATVLQLHGSRVDKRNTSVNSMGTVSNGERKNE